MSEALTRLSEGEEEDGAAGGKDELNRGLLEVQENLVVTPAGSNTSLYSNMSEKVTQSLVFSNQNNMSQNLDKVPIWRKVAFAVGAMPYAMCSTIISFYFSIFLLEVVILDPVYVLIILFSGRVWDAVTDPIVGYLTSFTRTRFGRLRPWLAGAMIPSGVLYFFLFYVPPLDNYPQYYKYIYYQILYLLYEASLSCIHVPFTALTVHISNNPKERDLVTVIRMCFEASSVLLGIGIHTLFYAIFVGGESDSCDAEERLPSENERSAYRWHALFLGALTVLFVSVTVFGVKEQEAETKVNKSIGFFRGLKEIWTFRPYFLLMMVTVLGWLALQFLQGNLALYIKYSLGKTTEYPYMITAFILSVTLFMVFWQLIIVKFGKKTAYFCGIWSLLPILLTQLYLDRLPWLAYIVLIFAGAGVASMYLLPWSMLPDVIDESVLKFSVRREELYYAYFVFGNKFGGGFTLAFSTAVLKIVGYDEMKCDQSWLIPLTMKLLVTVLPFAFIICGLPFLWKYPITEKTRERVKSLLNERRKRSSSDARVEEESNSRPTSVSSARHDSSYRSRTHSDNSLSQTYF